MNSFCREVSLQQADPLTGTGTHETHNLLLSWPISKWLKNLRKASDMSDEVSTLVDRIFESGRRVNLIDRKSQPTHHHRAYLMPECTAYDIPHDQVGRFLSALLNGQSLTTWFAETVTGSVALCCTHGKKDRCCAKFGNATYKAMSVAAEALNAPIEVWQSSHLGGCRLAASTIVFPQLHKYGRIQPDQVEALIRSEMAGHIYLPCYRGDSTLNIQQQVAEVAVRKWLNERLRKTPIRMTSTTQPLGNQIQIHWQSQSETGIVNVQLVEETVIRFDTCADIDAQKQPEMKSVWRVQTILPLFSDILLP